MNRDLSRLADTVFDVVIIGGGIYGACTAWDAAARGLSVALLEKRDFASGTSSNSLKIIHGGLRYLQHGDVGRIRASVRERRILMRIAPHLVHPLPVLIPTFGYGMRSRWALSLALAVNDLLSFDRNRGLDGRNHLPRGRTISREECLHIVPGIDRPGLTGGAIFYDAQVYNSERLVLAFLRSSEQKGACLANYVEVVGFLQEADRVIGVRAKDQITGDTFEVHARAVVNTAGPWVGGVLGLIKGRRLGSRFRFAKAINLVTPPLYKGYAIGVSGMNGYRDPDAVIDKGNRLLFITPWRGRSLIGTAYFACDEAPDELRVTQAEVESFLDQINEACPSAGLGQNGVSLVHRGLVPIKGPDRQTGSIRLAKHHQIYDHRHDGFEGLISVVGVKYTTARHVAERVVDLIFASLGCRPPKSGTSAHPLHGGDVGVFETYLRGEVAKRPRGLKEDQVTRLIRNYGSAYREVLRHLDGHDGAAAQMDDLAVARAECLHGVREEMALKLSDLVFRRTELGTAGPPGSGTLKIYAEAMGEELGWNQARMEEEIQQVREAYSWGSGL